MLDNRDVAEAILLYKGVSMDFNTPEAYTVGHLYKVDLTPEQKDEILQIYLDDIIPNRFQPRVVFDERSLKELAVSIKEHGVIQTIIVRTVDNKYEIIACEIRYKASVMAGKTAIPAIVKVKDDKESV